MRAMGDSGEGGGYSVFIVTGRWENFGWHLLWKYIVTRDFWGVLNKSGKIQQWIFCGLRCRGNLTPVSNVCAAALTSLFWAHNGRITGSAFRISFQSDWQIYIGFFNRPIMARAQILVHRRGPRTSILALFCRRTLPEFSFVCGAG